MTASSNPAMLSDTGDGNSQLGGTQSGGDTGSRAEMFNAAARCCVNQSVPDDEVSRFR